MPWHLPALAAAAVAQVAHHPAALVEEPEVVQAQVWLVLRALVAQRVVHLPEAEALLAVQVAGQPADLLHPAQAACPLD